MASGLLQKNIVFIDTITTIEKNHLLIADFFSDAKILPVVFSGKLADFLSKNKIQKVLIRKGAFSLRELNQIVNQLLKLEMVPFFVKITAKKISVEKIRIQDLMIREDFSHKNKSVIHPAISQKTILITGAAGSVGSELLIQTAQYQPQKIVALDKDAKRLKLLEKKVATQFVDFVHADITDRKQLEKVFKKYHFDYLFHSAAFKFVPEAESHPSETVITNIFGTILLAEMAQNHNCEVFVNISTDKAVHPFGIMGKSKRCAELFLLNRKKSPSPTRFVITRFGNIIGSRGSVIPVFERQIQKNVPLTVTHPVMKRFFMSVKQAAEMVLFATATGNSGDLFVYDMGKPFSVKRIAEKMISLSGKKITSSSIIYSSVRPGEKLSEQLYDSKAIVFPTKHKKIIRVEEIHKTPANFDDLLQVLQRACSKKQDKKVVEILSEILSKYE